MFMARITPDEVAAKVAHLPVTVEGSRRPLLLESIIEKGLTQLRPGSTATRSVLLTLVSFIEKTLLTHYIQENDRLLDRVAELEQRLKRGGLFDPVEQSLIRTYHKYGITVPELAVLFKATEEQIDAVVRGSKKPTVRKRKATRRDLTV